MKQTNNALKYLLAQYRAIFKNAYFKGLVSATVLTAGLAAVGTAQAAALTSADLPTDGSTVTIDGTANTNIYQSDVSGDLPLNGQLVINSGDAGNSGSTDNLFQASTAANLTGSKFGITIDSKTADANTVGLAIAVNNSTNTTDHFKVDIGSIDVTKGKLALGMASQSGSLFVSADSITIGTGTAISDTGNNTEDKIAAKVQLGGGIAAGTYNAPSGDGTITFGNGYTAATGGAAEQAASITTLNKSGIIEFLGAADHADKVVFAGQLVGKGGELDFTSGSGKIEAYGTDVNANVTVGNDQKAVVLLTDSAETDTINEGLLQFTAGTIDVQGKGTGTSGGQIVVSGGVLEVVGKTLLTSSVAGGTSDGEVGSILVSGASANAPATFRTSSQNVLEFLNSNEIAKDTTDYAAGIVLSGTATGQSVLEFTDTTQIDLYDLVTDDPNDENDLNITIGNSNTVSGGLLSVSGGTIKATNLAVSNGSANLTLDKAFLEADDLTLGSKDYDPAGTNKITLSGSTVHNSLTLSTKDNAAFVFTAGTHNLEADYYDSQLDDNGNWISNTVAPTHYINGADFQLSGSATVNLKVNGGTWSTTGQDITLGDSGALTVATTAATVDSSIYKNDGNPATLIVDGGTLTIGTTTGSGSIAVTGASGANATLDLRNANKVTFTSGSITASGSAIGYGSSVLSEEQFAAFYPDAFRDQVGYGIIKINQNTFDDYVNQTGAGNGVTLLVDGGGIVEVSDLRTAQYDVEKFSGGSAAGNKGVVVLDADSYFVVDGDLNLYDGMAAAGTSEEPVYGTATDVSGLDIGSGTIIADRVNLTIYGRDTVTVGNTEQQVVSDAKFVEGTVEVSEGFTINSSTLILGSADTNGTNASLVLDAGIGNTGTLMGTGERTIEMVGGTASGGNIDILTGAWGQEQLDLSATGSGTGLTVGSTDRELIEQAQALSTDEATVYVAQYIGDNFAGATASGNILTVNEQSQAVFNTIQLGDSSRVNVYGHLLINGLNVANPGDDATDPAYVNPNDDDTYTTTAGISLGAATLNVSGPTADLEFGATATSALVNLNGDPDDDNNDKSAIALTEGGINTANFELSEFGHLTLNFTSGTAVNADDAKFFTTQFLSSSDETAYLVLNNADLGIQYETRDDGLYEVTWDNLKPFVNIVGSQATTDKLKQALVSHIGAGEAIKGHYGAASVDAASTTALSLNGATSFSNAAAFGGQFVTSERDGKVMGVQFTNEYTSLSLENGGTIGAIKGYGDYTGDYNSLYITSPAGALTTIAGSVTEINDFTVDSETEVNGQVAVEYLDLGANLTTTATNQGVTTNDGVVRANATLTTDRLTIGGANSTTHHYGQLDVLGTIQVTGTEGITVNSSTTDDGSLALFGGYVSASKLTLDDNSYVAVGYEPTVGQQDDPTTDYIDESQSYTGFLEITGTTTLNGGALVLDPEYGQATAMASLNDLYQAPVDANSLVAGTLDGNVFVGQNSALGIHSDSMATLQYKVARFQNGQTLVEDNVGAVTYIGGSFTVGAGQGLILTKYTLEEFANDYNLRDGVTVDQLTEDTVVTASLFDNTVFLGANTALLIDADVMHTAAQGRNNAVITFAGSAGVNNGTGTVIADGGDIVIDGDVRASTYQVFSNAAIKYIDGTAYAVVEDSAAANYANNINVTTENDFLQGVVDTTGAVTLGVNPNGRAIMHGASDPVYASLVAYARGYNGAVPTTEEAAAHPVAAESGYTQIAGVSDDRLLHSYDAQGNRVYGQYSNYFLQETISTGDGSAAEAVARLATYGGAVQAAITAGASSYDAISGRMGMGATGYNLTVADNTQGAALWVSPLYKSSESDGFDAEGVDYGVDLNLYGVALGADYTLANGVSFGAMFNVGSGDVDGKDAGSAVSNDFDYYGFGVYAGYSVNNFKVVADLTYTVADNDLEGNTAIDTVGASIDTSNLSFGVTAQYAFDFTAATVTPHAGLRYSYIDMDDYDIDGEGTVASYDGDSLGIFSIPVGVTIAKEFVGDNWSVKPSFDLTLTGNFGDDETDGTVHWAGVDNLSTNVSSEVIDNFTYGATLGVAAKTGNFSIGLGVNYTGSSNTDEYGVNANARFVF